MALIDNAPCGAVASTVDVNLISVSSSPRGRDLTASLPLQVTFITMTPCVGATVATTKRFVGERGE